MWLNLILYKNLSHWNKSCLIFSFILLKSFIPNTFFTIYKNGIIIVDIFRILELLIVLSLFINLVKYLASLIFSNNLYNNSNE